MRPEPNIPFRTKRHTKWKRPGGWTSVRSGEVRNLHVLFLEAEAERPVQRGRGEIVIHDGPEFGATGGGKVPLILEDEKVGAQSDLQLFLFSGEFLFGQFPGDPISLDALVVGLNGTNGVLDLKEDLLLLALEVEKGLLPIELGLGIHGLR